MDNTSGALEFLPRCWIDDERMNVLFSPFRRRDVNPVAYDSKMKFWQVLIADFCKARKQIIINNQELTNHFNRNGQKPACLGTVINDMTGKGMLVDFNSFNMMTEMSWKKWAVDKFISTPVRWTFEKFKSTLIDSTNPELPLIHLQTVQDLGNALVNNVPSNLKGKLLSVHEVLELSGLMNKEDLLMILQWLRRTHQIALSTNKAFELELIKFGKTKHSPAIITEVDIGVYSLQAQENNLKIRIEHLEQDKQEALKHAKKYVAVNMRTMAKNSLRQKRELEKHIEKRVNALENIQNLLLRIEQAESDAAVLDCYKTGVRALKETLNVHSLTESNVVNTMDELEDTLNVHKDLGETMARPMDLLEDDLEEELAVLLQLSVPEEPHGPTGGHTSQLPDVPTHSITPAKTDAQIDFEKRFQALSL